MTRKSVIVSFYLALICSGVFGLVLQSWRMQLPVNSILGGCYLANFALAAFVFTALVLLRNRHVEKLGFLFLAGSFLKFIVFFLAFYPVFQQDGSISRTEFFVFFLPYGLSTFIETLFLVRFLNKA